MANVVKTVNVKIDLTPEDIVKALRSFTAEDWHQMQHLLVEENINVMHWLKLPWAESNDLSVPPPTVEGDQEALAAAESLFHIFDDLDPQVVEWGATSPELALENSW